MSAEPQVCSTGQEADTQSRSAAGAPATDILAVSSSATGPLKIDARWKQINGALRYKASKQQQLGDNAKVIEGKIVEHDPVHGQLRHAL